MKTILDQEESYLNESVTIAKWMSGIAILLVTLFIVFVAIKTYYDKSTLSSPWLPSYTVIFINASLINMSCFGLVGIVSSTICWFRKKYWIAFALVLTCFFTGFILKNSVTIYQYFY